MNYRLAVLTHGDSRTLTRTLRSFTEHVYPSPTQTIFLYDGPELRVPDDLTFFLRNGLGDLVFAATGRQMGFCEATRTLWELAVMAAPTTEFVFWLEHDFVFDWDVDLFQLAEVLDERPHLAQMALMRNAVNSSEVAAGGLYELRRGEYTPASSLDLRWLEHRSYFTTNPSLMRSGFMVEHPWPDYPDQCEGRFGVDLREQGYSFGVWGRGDPWVEHIGTRDGHGY